MGVGKGVVPGARGESTVIVVVAELPWVHTWVLVACIVTVYTPERVYVCCGGFFKFDVVPSPNCQYQFVGLFDDVSVYCTVNGAGPLVGVAVKEDTGLGGTINTIVPVFPELLEYPPSSLRYTE